jgi:hypothetical protein
MTKIRMKTCGKLSQWFNPCFQNKKTEAYQAERVLFVMSFGENELDVTVVSAR